MAVKVRWLEICGLGEKGGGGYGLHFKVSRFAIRVWARKVDGLESFGF